MDELIFRNSIKLCCKIVKTYPSLMTAMLLKASGTDTPAATKVNPITVSGIPSVLPKNNLKLK